MSRMLQTPTVYFSRVSYLLECNANDTYVLRMTHVLFVLNTRIVANLLEILLLALI